MKLLENNIYILIYLDYLTKEFKSITFILRPDSVFYPFVNKFLELNTLIDNRFHIISINDISQLLPIPVTKKIKSDFIPTIILENIERLNYDNDIEYFKTKFPQLYTEINNILDTHSNPPTDTSNFEIEISNEDIFKFLNDLDPKNQFICEICGSELKNGLCPDCCPF